MLRGDDILCGTSTTGTGALTLGAVPEPPGGLDFDTWLRALGFGNSAAVPVSYTIEEYSDTTFSKVVGKEKGVGILTLGASAGIANCTLTRTTSQFSVTGMNGSSPSFSAGSAYSIVTAANTLVYIAASSYDLDPPAPAIQTAFGDGYGDYTDQGVWSASSYAFSTNQKVCTPFFWNGQSGISSVAVYVDTIGAASLRLGLYTWGIDGLPDNLIREFTATTQFDLSTATGWQALTAPTNFSKVPLPPGKYYLYFFASAGAGTIHAVTMNDNPKLSTTGSRSIIFLSPSGQTYGPLPASLNGIGMTAQGSSNGFNIPGACFK